MKWKNYILSFIFLIFHAKGLIASQFTIVVDKGNDHAKQALVHALHQSTFKSTNTVLFQESGETCSEKFNKASTDSNLIISLGENAFSYALSCSKHTPIFATYIHQNAFHHLSKHHHTNTNRQIGGLFLDPQIGSQYDLIEAIAKEMAFTPKLGILISPLNERLIPVIKKQAKKRNLECYFVIITSNDDPIQAWHHLLNKTNIILAIPDANIFNQHNARGMLLMASRHRTPVVAYSKSFVNIGALAALYCTKQQISEELIRLLEHYNTPNGFHFIKNHYSQRYTVAFNFYTGHVLGGYITTKQQIIKHLTWYDL